MNTTTLEQITVSKVNQHGVRINDKQYNKSPNYKGPEFEVGLTYEAVVYTSPGGAKYINSAKLLKEVATKPVEQSKTSNTKDNNSQYWDKQGEGQKEGNRRNVSAILTQGLTIANGLTEQDAVATYNRIHDILVQQDAK